MTEQSHVGDTAQSVEESIPTTALGLEFNIQGQIISFGHSLQAQSHDSKVAESVANSIAKSIREIASELAASIAACNDKKDFAGAAAIVRKARNDGNFALPINEPLLNALLAIDTTTIDSEDRIIVLRCVVVTASELQQQQRGRNAAEALLAEPAANFEPDERAAFEMVRAIAMIKSGRVESGLFLLREVASNADFEPETRAWAWRNISLALHTSDPGARHAAEESTSAFLEAGKKHDAIRSLRRVIDCTKLEEPQVAVAVYEKALSLTETDSTVDRALRVAILHESASMLSQLGRHPEAFERAKSAAHLARRLVGRNAQLVAALYLASIEGRASGHTDEANEFELEAQRQAAESNLTRWRLAEQLTNLIENYSQTAAADLMRDAKGEGDEAIVSAVTIVQARLDQSFSDGSKLELLEERLEALETSIPSDKLVGSSLQFTLAQLLERIAAHDRATGWFRRAHDADPFDGTILGSLINNLWRRELWGDASTVLKQQIARVGERPDLMFAYSRSLFESGNISDAIPALGKTWELIVDRPGLRQIVSNLQSRAMRIASEARLINATVHDAAHSSIRVDAIGEAIREFAAFIASEKRLRFWQPKEKGRRRKWRVKPEQYGQDLLHTYLEGKFGRDAEILEELPAGAGRLDVLIRIASGVSFVVELKICGGSYPSSYAAAGELQLRHYMKNKNTQLGYLLVFDGRIKLFGRALASLPDFNVPVEEIFVDLRPVIT